MLHYMYFDKSLSVLTLSESAPLVEIQQSPSPKIQNVRVFKYFFTKNAHHDFLKNFATPSRNTNLAAAKVWGKFHPWVWRNRSSKGEKNRRISISFRYIIGVLGQNPVIVTTQAIISQKWISKYCSYCWSGMVYKPAAPCSTGTSLHKFSNGWNRCSKTG